jgi:antitoxin (DNA-binding transcriptional repressor) of toxin-antitoxin stability system
MPAKTIDLAEVHPTLSDLVPIVVGGTEITLTRNNAPLVRLIPATVPVTPRPRTAGLHRGAARMSEDFDEPLPEAFWLGTQ